MADDLADSDNWIRRRSVVVMSPVKPIGVHCPQLYMLQHISSYHIDNLKSSSPNAWALAGSAYLQLWNTDLNSRPQQQGWELRGSGQIGCVVWPGVVHVRRCFLYPVLRCCVFGVCSVPHSTGLWEPARWMLGMPRKGPANSSSIFSNSDGRRAGNPKQSFPPSRAGAKDRLSLSVRKGIR